MSIFAVKTKPMFFQPRIGQHYREGFKGYRTLVLGVKHHCTLRHCRYFADCVLNKNCNRYDSLCLAYDCTNYVNGRKMCKVCIGINGEHCKYYEPRTMEEKHDNFLLSQSNIIEIDAFLEENDHYPAYTYFTKLVLNKSDDLTDGEKTNFWEHVAFANYLQYFCDAPQVPSYEGDGMTYRQEDWEAFKELMEELQPEVVFVWNPALKTLLDKKIAEGEIAGLTHFDDFRSETLTVNRYLYKLKAKNTPENLFKAFQREFGADLNDSEIAQLMLNALQKARFRQFVPTAELKITSAMVEWVNGSIWNERLSRYLIGLRQKEIGLDALVSPFKPELSKAIKDCHVASSFLLDFMKTQAISLEDAQRELSWFEFGKCCLPEETDVVIVYLSDPNDVFRSILKLLDVNGLKKVLILVETVNSDKLLLDVMANRTHLSHIVEKKQVLLIQFDDKNHERVCLEYEEKENVRSGVLERGQSLCPSDYLSTEKPDITDLIFKVFGKYKMKVCSNGKTIDLVELLEELWKEGYIKKCGKKLKVVKSKSPQLLYYCLHSANIEYYQLERLFVYDNMKKNTNEAKIKRILDSDKDSVVYYKKKFNL